MNQQQFPLTIQVNNLNYSYSAEQKTVLKNINLNIKKGSFSALIGPSGCGKTTLLLLLRGFYQEFGGKFSGSIKILGDDIKNTSVAKLGEKIGIIFQNPATQLHQLTVLDEISSAPIYQGVPYDLAQQKAKDLVGKIVGKGFEEKSPQELSSGQQQRVALAAALALDAQILLLDEPFVFLDTKADEEILKILIDLNKQGKTILVATHDLDLIAPVVDQIFAMESGEIKLSGTPKQVFYHQSFEKLLPAPLCVKTGKGVGKQVLEWGELLKQLKTKNLKLLKEGMRNLQRQPVVQVKNLSFSYSKNRVGVKNVNLEIGEGEIFGIIGANGSGKTTLVKLLMGFLKPRSGKINIFGQDFTSKKIEDRAGLVGYLTQDPKDMFFEMNLLDEVSFGPRMLKMMEPKEVAKKTLEKMGLGGMGDRHPDSLSGGQKSLLGLSDVLVLDPKILILDEPEFGLDPGSWEMVTSTLKNLQKEGKTIIVITQDLEACLFLCDRCALVKEGEILSVDTPKNLFSDEKLIKSSGLSPLPIFSLLPHLPNRALENEENFISETVKLLKGDRK